jgi:hypothetical protein
MKNYTLPICFSVFLIFMYLYPVPEIPNAHAVSGATSVVFFRTSSAAPAAGSPNVRVCIMNQGTSPDKGLVREAGTTGGQLQTKVCDSWVSVLLGKSATVNITGATWWGAQVDQDTKFNHDGSAVNFGIISSGSFWGEGVR